MNFDYTTQLENALYSRWGSFDSAEDEYSEIIQLLNSADFRTFGDGLSAVIASKCRENESPLDCLKRCCREHGIQIHEELAAINTLKSWFSGGKRPKKSTESRIKMFVIAFALELTPEQTADLFQKVYLDRAFDFRSADELVYYYCLDRGLPYNCARELIQKIDFDYEENDHTQFTQSLRIVVNQIQNDGELISFIRSHPHNFSIRNTSARKAVKEYLEKAKKDVGLEVRSPFYKDIIRGRDLDSTKFMYEVITGQYDNRSRESVFNNSELPQEIRNSFPSEAVFAKAEPGYDELRKMLVFLFSYHFWFEVQYQHIEADLEDYSSQLNDLLIRTGLPMLYPGNPFDWLFCFCTMSDTPLDTFRGIVAEVRDNCQ